MKLIPYDEDKIVNYGKYRKTKNQIILTEFLDSGLTCAKIEDYPHTTAAVCVESLKQSAKRFGINNVYIFRRKDSVFIVRKD